jgi:hypothetical protein
MRIEINGDAEKLIQAGLASGKFQSAEEAVAAMARAWAESASDSAQALPRLSPSTDIRDLAAKQGIQPFNPNAKRPDFWPPDESVAEFLAFLHDVRHDDGLPQKQ